MPNKSLMSLVPQISGKEFSPWLSKEELANLVCPSTIILIQRKTRKVPSPHIRNYWKLFFLGLMIILITNDEYIDSIGGISVLYTSIYDEYFVQNENDVKINILVAMEKMMVSEIIEV